MVITTNRILPGTGLLAVLCCVLLNSSVQAQPGTESVLDVAPGDTILYLVKSSYSIQSQLESVEEEQKMQSLETMVVDSIVGDSIFWTVRMMLVESEVNGRSTEQPGALPLLLSHRVTDLSGALVREWDGRLAPENKDKQIPQVGTSPLGKGPDRFLTKDMASRKPGERWQESWADTLDPEQDGTPATVIMNQTIEYECGGVVDTLGERTLRISYRSVDMNYVSSSELPGTGVQMVLRGEGEMEGVLYYSTGSRLTLLDMRDTDLNQFYDTGGPSQLSIEVHEHSVRSLLR